MLHSVQYATRAIRGLLSDGRGQIQKVLAGLRFDGNRVLKSARLWYRTGFVLRIYNIGFARSSTELYEGDGERKADGTGTGRANLRGG